MIKKMLLAAMAVTAFACTPKIENKVYNEGINIIPVPASLTEGNGKFTITSSTVIVVNQPKLANPVAYLASKIKAATGYDIAITNGAPATNYIVLDIAPNLDVNDQGYTLVSTPEFVKIDARTAQGAFYGVQTLLQLLPAEIESPKKINYIEWSLPSVTIKDEPRFDYRGAMLDICRHFGGVEYVKRQIDVLSMFKINRLHWHLTDDQAWRIEIKKYPKLTEMGSLRTEGDGSTYGPFFYTQEQIKEVVAYATEHYVDVIPEIELPGHGLAALTGYPEYSCTGGPFTPRIIWGVEDEVFCVGKDSTFNFLTDIIDEVIELFPSQYFHIGGDECPKVRWESCPACQARAKELGLKPTVDKFGVSHSVEAQLQSYAVARIQKHLTAKGKTMIGWDEILEGGLTPGAIVMSWRGTEGGLTAASMGNKAIMTPSSEGWYLDQYQDDPEIEPVTIGGRSTLARVYKYEPIPADMPAEQHQFIWGVQGNGWSEYMLSEGGMEYMLYPRILAVAEVGWSPASARDYDKFAQRINNACVRLDFHNINYHIPQPQGPVTPNVVLLGENVKVGFNNSRNYPMVYTLDGSEPNVNSTKYTDSLTFTDNGVIKIATVMPSQKMSKVRTVNVEKQKLKKGTAEATTVIKAKVAKGLFETKEKYANAQFGADTVVAKLHGSIKYDMKSPSLTVYEGTFELPEDGVYTLAADMDEIWIDDELVIDNNPPKMVRHLAHKVQKAYAAGTHSYKITFNNMIKSGWPSEWNEIAFFYKAPNSTQYVRAVQPVEEKK